MRKVNIINYYGFRHLTLLIYTIIFGCIIIYICGCCSSRTNIAYDIIRSYEENGNDKKNLVAAIVLLRDELAKNPDDRRIAFEIGKSYYRLNDYNNTMMYLLSVADSSDTISCNANNLIGKMHFKNGKYFLSIKYISAVLQNGCSGIDSASLLIRRATALEKIGETKKSVDDLILAQKMRPDDISLQNRVRQSELKLLNQEKENKTVVKHIYLNNLFKNAVSGDTIFIPSDKWTVKTPLVLNKLHDIVIIGQEGASIYLDDLKKSVLILEECDNIVIENLHMQHLKPLKTYECQGSVISIDKCNNISVKSCELNGSGAVGVNCRNSENIIVEKCYLHHNTFNAIYLYNCQNIKIYANFIENNQNTFQFHRTNDVIVSENIIRDNKGYWREAVRPGAEQWIKN